MTCQDCKQDKPDVKTVECPFIREIDSRTEMVNLCENCLENRWDEI